MCKYCEFNLNDCIYLGDDECIPLAEESFTTLYLCKNNNNFFLRAYGDNKADFAIKFCPICGQKLE